MKHFLVFVLPLLLLLLTSCHGGRSGAMEALLDRADSLNRAYVPMTGGLDSLLREAVAYYDRHGTADEQVRAHYLLGCAYRDMGEAPAALRCYQDAVDRADTLDDGCDIRRLMSVYGQMAALFHAQNLPSDELLANSQVRHCAEMLNDTLTFIRSIELDAKPYYLLRDTMSMLRVLQQARQLYIRHGYQQESAAVYPLIIDLFIGRDSLAKAKELMEVFESRSGLFDSVGNISAGRESYYELKGLYYYKNRELDSAEYYFRKLLPYGMNADAYRGLLSVYQYRRDNDSICSFVRLYEESVDNEQDELRTQTLHQMSSLYNYQRFLRKSDAESQRAARLKILFLLVLFCIAILLSGASFIFIIQSQRKKQLSREAERLRKDYSDAIAKKEVLAGELEILMATHEQLKASEHETASLMGFVREQNSQLLAAKEKEVAVLNEMIGDYAMRLLHTTRLLGNSPQFTLLIEDFHQKASRRKGTSLPKKSEWELLIKLFAETYPQPYVASGADKTLSVQELRAFILIFLEFSNGEIMSLLDISAQRMTNVKSRINEKLFGEANASTLSFNMKNSTVW